MEEKTLFSEVKKRHFEVEEKTGPLRVGPLTCGWARRWQGAHGDYKRFSTDRENLRETQNIKSEKRERKNKCGSRPKPYSQSVVHSIRSYLNKVLPQYWGWDRGRLESY